MYTQSNITQAFQNSLDRTDRPNSLELTNLSEGQTRMGVDESRNSRSHLHDASFATRGNIRQLSSTLKVHTTEKR
jgi:hypothetical protein